MISLKNMLPSVDTAATSQHINMRVQFGLETGSDLDILIVILISMKEFATNSTAIINTL